MSKTYMNEILISYKTSDDAVFYTVTDSKNEMLAWGERSYGGLYVINAEFEWNMAIEFLISLGINDLNKVEIERSMSTLGNRLIWVRY